MNPVFFLAPLIVLAAGAVNRRRIGRWREREYREAFVPGDDGVVKGAEGFTLRGTNGKALLVIHGSGDTPQSVRYLCDQLHAAGYSVHAPLLPGHGRSPRAFAQATADDYREATSAAYHHLRATHEWVGLVGLSMGGALVARLAADVGDVPVVVLLAPYVGTPRTVRWVHSMGWLWSLAAPYVAGGGDSSIHDKAAQGESRAYGTFSSGALTALVETAKAGRAALPRLHMPVLVVNSANDNRIPREVAEAALRDLAPSAERHWVDGCGHVITVDYCKDVVARLVLTFLARHAG